MKLSTFLVVILGLVAASSILLVSAEETGSATEIDPNLDSTSNTDVDESKAELSGDANLQSETLPTDDGNDANGADDNEDIELTEEELQKLFADFDFSNIDWDKVESADVEEGEAGNVDDEAEDSEMRAREIEFSTSNAELDASDTRIEAEILPNTDESVERIDGADEAQTEGKP